MAQTKVTANLPPPSINYKPLYPWASDELLAETSSLTSFADWRAYLDSEPDFKGKAFRRVHDAYISVRPCTTGEPLITAPTTVSHSSFSTRPFLSTLGSASHSPTLKGSF